MSAVLMENLPETCREAARGSSWAALLVAINTRPANITELLRTVGAPEGVSREQVFDACSDAWSIYEDALEHGAHL